MADGVKPESIPWIGECANCGYGIRHVDDVGWIHAEVPQYDGHECGEAKFGPVDPWEAL